MNAEHAMPSTLPSLRCRQEPGAAERVSAAAAVPSTLVRAVKLRRGARESRCVAGHPWLCIMRMDHLRKHDAVGLGALGEDPLWHLSGNHRVVGFPHPALPTGHHSSAGHPPAGLTPRT